MGCIWRPVFAHSRLPAVALDAKHYVKPDWTSPVPVLVCSCSLFDAYGDFVTLNGSTTGPKNYTYYFPPKLTAAQKQSLPPDSYASTTSDSNVVIRLVVYNVSDVPNAVDLMRSVSSHNMK